MTTRRPPQFRPAPARPARVARDLTEHRRQRLSDLARNSSRLAPEVWARTRRKAIEHRLDAHVSRPSSVIGRSFLTESQRAAVEAWHETQAHGIDRDDTPRRLFEHYGAQCPSFARIRCGGGGRRQLAAPTRQAAVLPGGWAVEEEQRDAVWRFTRWRRGRRRDDAGPRPSLREHLRVRVGAQVAGGLGPVHECPKLSAVLAGSPSTNGARGPAEHFGRQPLTARASRRWTATRRGWRSPPPGRATNPLGRRRP